MRHPALRKMENTMKTNKGIENNKVGESKKTSPNKEHSRVSRLNVKRLKKFLGVSNKE